MSDTVASTPSSTTTPKTPRILACVLCQARKIKCDKHFPCSNCLKANVTCTPSTPAPARKRRRPNQDLQERLARCEELLKEYATAKPDDPEAFQPPQQQQHQQHQQHQQQKQQKPSQRALPLPAIEDPDPFSKWKPTGKLVVEDGTVRFVDNFLLGTLHEELKAMRDMVDETESTVEPETPEDDVEDDNADVLLGGDVAGMNLEDLQPNAGHIFQLWQIYLERVNPLLKVTHVPTIQPLLVEAATGSGHLPKSVGALLFSIYTLTTVACTEEECQAILGYSKDKALKRFSAGVRLNLIRMGFLKSYDFVTLQALVLYLHSLQGRYNRHAAWILNGVTIRMAQKMGLHRDGELLGLSPFDSEMRRRLWWQIVMLDVKYAMLSGLSSSVLPRGWDTKEPKNVNDADLFPGATEIKDREGPTEMIFCLMTYKIAKFLAQSPHLECVILENELGLHSPVQPSKPQVEHLKQLIDGLGKDLLEVLDKKCDPTAGPLHQFAFELRNLMLGKLKIMLHGQDQPEWDSEIRTPRDNAFKIAVTTAEHQMREHRTARDSGFLWFMAMHFQVDLFAYMVSQLSMRTTGQLVERAWAQVETIYEFFPQLLDVSKKQHWSLASMMLKAWKVREDVLIARTGQQPETPSYILELQRNMPDGFSPAYTSSSSQATPPSTAAMPVDQLMGGYLDTTALDWDMWANMNPVGGNAPMLPAFGSFGLGPSTDWS